jgi:CheY-like chemotaxis protein
MADILLIDDMAGVRRAVTSMLKSSGHTVTAAENGIEGLAMLKQRRFDLVVTDMLMPALDGSEVLAQLSAMPNRPKVIAISGGGAGVSADMALRAARASADAYLEKPFERTDLLAVIDRLLGKAA